MKINDFITEHQDMAEAAPYGFGTRMGAALKGAFGVDAAKAKSEIAKMANQIYNEFSQYALRAGLADENYKLNAVRKDDLDSWLKSKNYPVLQTTPGGLGILDLENPDTIKYVFTTIAQDKYKQSYNSAAAPAPAAPAARQPAARPAPAARQPAARQPAATPAVAKTSDYQNVLSILKKNTLSDKQKRKILQLLSTNP